MCCHLVKATDATAEPSLKIPGCQLPGGDSAAGDPDERAVADVPWRRWPGSSKDVAANFLSTADGASEAGRALNKVPPPACPPAATLAAPSSAPVGNAL